MLRDPGLYCFGSLVSAQKVTLPQAMYENLSLRRRERERDNTILESFGHSWWWSSCSPATTYWPYLDTYGGFNLVLEEGSNSSNGSFLQSSSTKNLSHATHCPWGHWDKIRTSPSNCSYQKDTGE